MKFTTGSTVRAFSLAVMSLCLIPAAPRALGDQAIAFTNYNSSFAPTIGNSAVYGYNFDVTAPIDVTALDWTILSPGVAAYSHDIGIWNAGGSLVVSGTVTPSDSTTGNSAYTLYHGAVPTTLLSPGSYTIGGVTGDQTPTGTADVFVAAGNPYTGLAIGPDITIGAGVFNANSNTLIEPTVTDPPFGPFVGPNFDYTVASATPEPGSLAILCAAMGSAGLAARRRRGR